MGNLLEICTVGKFDNFSNALTLSLNKLVDTKDRRSRQTSKLEAVHVAESIALKGYYDGSEYMSYTNTTSQIQTVTPVRDWFKFCWKHAIAILLVAMTPSIWREMSKFDGTYFKYG
jgi:hypothetical protein